MNKKTREIEMYVGYCDHTWSTLFISIPSNTLEVEKNAIAIATKLFYNNPRTHDEVAFIGVYHIPEMEEEENHE